MRRSKNSPMWVFQAPERTGPRDPRTNYRRGFHAYVIARFPLAHVLLLEPNPIRLTELQELWRDHPNVEIVPALWCEAKDCPGEHRFFCAAAPDGSMVYSDDAYYAQRFNPASEPSRFEVPCWSLSQLPLDARVSLMSIDVAVRTQVENFQKLDSSRVSAFMVTALDAPQSDEDLVSEHLKSTGFRAGGRPWGEAGSGSLFVKENSIGQSLFSRTNQLRVGVGEALVFAREYLPLGGNQVFLGRRIASMVNPARSTTLNIDPTFGKSLSPIRRSTVEDTIRAARSSKYTFEVEVEEQDSDEIALQCLDEFGVFPISFSHPQAVPLREPTGSLNTIVPGFPYSFDDETSYMNHYADSNMAITHRKAGWDCFRHAEIAASGAIPLMPDIRDVPRYSMIHYPKQAYAEILNRVLQKGSPGPETRRSLRDHFLRFQTTRSQADYILRLSGLSHARSILFFDGALPDQSDYLSVLSLIGFKELLAERCAVTFPVSYIYERHVEAVSGLYGRGFGYTRILEDTDKSPLELSPKDDAEIATAVQSSDAVVVGSAYRNLHRLDWLLQHVIPERLILLYGEDTPPSMPLLHQLKATGANIFVRPIHK